MNYRSLGLDLLRILAMCMITSIHFICYSDIRLHFSELPLYNKVFLNTLETINVNFINLFVLLSGYFLCSKEIRYNKIPKLWLQVIFVCYVTTLVVVLLSSAFDSSLILSTCFPILSGNYWYIISYFLLFLLAPILNNWLKITPPLKIKRSLIVAGIISTILLGGNPLINEVKYIGQVYSITWFAYIYLIGGYLYYYGKKQHVKTYIIAFFVAFLLIFILKWFDVKLWSCNLSSNSSLLTLVCSISLFQIMNSIETNRPSKIVSFLSTSSLYVYLVQETPIFREWFWNFIDVDKYYCTGSLMILWIIALLVIWLSAVLMFVIYKHFDTALFSKIANKINKQYETIEH